MESASSMSEYQKLINFIKVGKLDLYFVISMPRTRSTALHLCLSQGPEINGQICHPMNSGIFARSQNPEFRFNDFRDSIVNISVEEVSSRINKIVTPVIQQYGNAKFVVNEHAKFLTPEHLPFLLDISKNFIFSIRDPRIQFLSHMIRVINECFLEDNSKDEKCFGAEDIIMFLKAYCVSSQELEQKLNETITQKKIKIYKGDIWHKYTGGHESSSPKTSVVDIFIRVFLFLIKEIEVTWDNTTNTLEYLLHSPQEIKLLSVDSEMFVKDPFTVVQNITTQIKGIGFSEQMVTKWNKDTRKKFVCFIYPKEEEKNNAWSGPAINSTQITNKNDSTRGILLDPKEVPESLGKLLLKADEIYKAVLKYSVV